MTLLIEDFAGIRTVATLYLDPFTKQSVILQTLI